MSHYHSTVKHHPNNKESRKHFAEPKKKGAK